MKFLDIDQWERKEHFMFFKTYEEPFFGITVEVDCTVAYTMAKACGVSFFLYYLHKALVAANQIESFRYRIDHEDRIEIHDEIHAGSTIDRSNGTFGFSCLPYHEVVEDFITSALPIIDEVKKSTELIPATHDQNVIYFSSLPWFRFTALSHARKYSINDSVPKISFGKVTDVNSKKMMPVSIHVHHALMDGRHVGEFVELFQQLLDSP